MPYYRAPPPPPSVFYTVLVHSRMMTDESEQLRCERAYEECDIAFLEHIFIYPSM